MLHFMASFHHSHFWFSVCQTDGQYISVTTNPTYDDLRKLQQEIAQALLLHDVEQAGQEEEAQRAERAAQEEAQRAELAAEQPAADALTVCDGAEVPQGGELTQPAAYMVYIRFPFQSTKLMLLNRQTATPTVYETREEAENAAALMATDNAPSAGVYEVIPVSEINAFWSDRQQPAAQQDAQPAAQRFSVFYRFGYQTTREIIDNGQVSAGPFLSRESAEAEQRRLAAADPLRSYEVLAV